MLAASKGLKLDCVNSELKVIVPQLET